MSDNSIGTSFLTKLQALGLQLYWQLNSDVFIINFEKIKAMYVHARRVVFVTLRNHPPAP